jgi:hypothetical protein
MTAFQHRIFAALWRRKGLIIGTAVLFAVVGAVRALLTSSYVAETNLLVTSVTLHGAAAEQESVSGVVPGALNPRVYETLALSYDVLGETLDALVQQDAFPDEPPPLHVFRQRLEAKAKTVDETTRPQSFSPLLCMTAKAKTAELASLILNEWVSVTINAAREVNRKRVAPAKVLLKESREEKFNELKETWKAIQVAEAEDLPELLRQEMDERVTLLVRLSDSLVTKQGELDGARQRLALAETELASEPMFLELGRAPSDTAYWIAQESKDGSATLEDKVMVSEEINPTYMSIRNSVHSTSEKVAALEAEVETLREQLVEQQAILAETREQYAADSALLGNLRTQESYQKEAYLAIARLDAYMEAAQKLAAEVDEEDGTAVGVNRISTTVYAAEDTGILGGKVSVVLMGTLGFLLACGVVVAQVLWEDVSRNLAVEPSE